jgi:hypothetical protein
MGSWIARSYIIRLLLMSKIESTLTYKEERLPFHLILPVTDNELARPVSLRLR